MTPAEASPFTQSSRNSAYNAKGSCPNDAAKKRQILALRQTPNLGKSARALPGRRRAHNGKRLHWKHSNPQRTPRRRLLPRSKKPSPRGAMAPKKGTQPSPRGPKPMLAIFKRRHLRKILDGTKTQTRRIHKYTLQIGKTYAVRDRWFSKAQGHILITRKFRQRLGDISPEDLQKEGFSSLTEFKKEWKKIFGPDSWNPDQIVTCYEFKLKTFP